MTKFALLTIFLACLILPLHLGFATPSITLDSPRYLSSQTATVTVTDAAASGSVSIHITSTSDSGGITINLPETGSGTHTFQSTFTFTSGSSSGSQLKAICHIVSSTASCDTITTTYGSTSTTSQMIAIDFGVQTGLQSGASQSFGVTSFDVGNIALVRILDPSANTNAGIIDNVNVNLKSTANPSGISLTLSETGANTGVFTGTFIFMTSNNLFSSAGTVTITDSDTAIPCPSTLTEVITSSSDPTTGISLVFPKGSSCIFSGKLSFGGFSSSTQNIIKATGGDFVSVNPQGSLIFTNGLVTPNTVSSRGALLVSITQSSNDAVTSTYQGIISSSASVGNLFGGGGGGGGIVSPGLVLDVAASLSGTGGSSPPPPTFSLGAFAQANLLPPDLEKKLLNHDPLDPIGTSNYGSVPYYPLSIDGNGYLIGGYANTLETVTEQVGKPANVTFTTISRPIMHMSIYTNLHNIADEISDSDTSISYDKGQQLKIVDPHGFFSKVTVDAKHNGNKQSISYNVVFAKSMPKSNIIMRAWDDHHASQDIKLFDAWQAVESGGSQTSNSNVPQTGLVQSIAPQPSPVQNTMPTNPELVDIVKQWGGYSAKSISDSEMLSDMGIDAKHIPSWYMKTSKWVVNNDVTPEEFVNAIKYLYDKGIIH